MQANRLGIRFTNTWLCTPLCWLPYQCLRCFLVDCNAKIASINRNYYKNLAPFLSTWLSFELPSYLDHRYRLPTESRTKKASSSDTITYRHNFNRQLGIHSPYTTIHVMLQEQRLHSHSYTTVVFFLFLTSLKAPGRKIQETKCGSKNTALLKLMQKLSLLEQPIVACADKLKPIKLFKLRCSTAPQSGVEREMP